MKWQHRIARNLLGFTPEFEHVFTILTVIGIAKIAIVNRCCVQELLSVKSHSGAGFYNGQHMVICCSSSGHIEVRLIIVMAREYSLCS